MVSFFENFLSWVNLEISSELSYKSNYHNEFQFIFTQVAQIAMFRFRRKVEFSVEQFIVSYDVCGRPGPRSDSLKRNVGYSGHGIPGTGYLTPVKQIQENKYRGHLWGGAGQAPKMTRSPGSVRQTS